MQLRFFTRQRTFPRYGIPFYRLSTHWSTAERLALEIGRIRATVRYALVVRNPISNSQQIGHAVIRLAHLLQEDEPALFRAAILGR